MAASPPTRVRKSAWNFSSGLLTAAGGLLTGLFATPYLVHWLGRERFGVFRVLIDWTAWLSLFDLGLAGALMGVLAPQVAAHNAAGVVRILSAGLRTGLRALPAVLVAGFVLIAALPRLIPVKTLQPAEVTAAAAILLLPLLWLPLAIFRSLADSQQRSYINNLLLFGQSLLTTAALLTAAWLGWGLPGQAAALALAQLPATAVLVWQGVRSYPSIFSTRPDRETLDKVLKMRWPNLWFTLSGRLGLLSDNLIVGFILGPTAVTSFFLTQRVIALLQSQLQALGASTWAGLVQLLVKGERDQFYLRFTGLTKLVTGLSAILLGTACAYNRTFISLWIGPASYAGDAVTVLTGIDALLCSLTCLWFWSVTGVGKISETAFYSACFLIVNLIVSVIGSFWLGLLGPLLGTFAGFLFVHSWAVPRVLARALDPRLNKIWLLAFSPLAWGLPYAALVWFVSRRFPPQNWVGLVSEAGLAFAGGLALWWWMQGTRERAEWIVWFRQIVPASV